MHALHDCDAKAMGSPPQQQVHNSHLHAFDAKPVGRPQPACEEFTLACKANGKRSQQLVQNSHLHAVDAKLVGRPQPACAELALAETQNKKVPELGADHFPEINVFPMFMFIMICICCMLHMPFHARRM